VVRSARTASAVAMSTSPRTTTIATDPSAWAATLNSEPGMARSYVRGGCAAS
jgi:hypothetical protein